MNTGDRVVLTHPTMGRDYGTVVGPGEPSEGKPTIMVDVDGRAINPQRHWLSTIQPATAARDMVIGDLLNLDMLKEVIEKPFLGTLWIEGDSGMMTPHVCEASFGDGMHLLKIATINQRPNYHVVRVDSAWAEGRYGWNYYRDCTIGEHIDDVLSAIEEECGQAGEYLDDPCDECGDTCCKCGDSYSADREFPALDDRDGCSWGDIRWPWLMKELGIA